MDGKSSESSLKFTNYIVNKVKFESNCDSNDKNIWKMKFDIQNQTKVNDEKDKMQVNLALSIFKGVEEAPFYMEIEIIGLFELNGDDDIRKYEANAIAIMYPYLRAIVSTYTASANVAPLILPAINVNAMLKNQKKEEN